MIDLLEVVLEEDQDKKYENHDHKHRKVEFVCLHLINICDEIVRRIFLSIVLPGSVQIVQFLQSWPRDGLEE